MPEATPPILDLQQAVTDILDGYQWFNLIAIINERMGDIEDLTAKVVGKLGTCVVVQNPTCNMSFPDIPSVYFDEVPLIVSCYAHTELNKVSNGGTGIHPFNTAQVVAAVLHQKRIEALADAEGNCPQLFCANPTIVPVKDELSAGSIGWDVYFRAHVGFTYTEENPLLDGNNQQLLDSMGLQISS